MNFRNSPVDKRYKETRDVPTGEAERQARRTKARVGAMAYQRNRPERTTTRNAGTGSEFGGQYAQALRAKEKAAEERRAQGFRPETLSVKDVRPEDPAYS